MLSLHFAALSLFAGATVYDMKPDRDAQLLIVLDGSMQKDDIYTVGNDTIPQVRHLQDMYAKTPYGLKVGFVLSSLAAEGNTCGWYSQLGGSEWMINSMTDILADAALSGNEKDRRTYNAILEAADSMFPARSPQWNDSVRRVVLHITASTTDFGAGTAVGNCATTEPTAAFFGNYFEDKRLGFMYAIISHNGDADLVPAETKILTATTLTDLIVSQEIYGKSGFDAIDHDIARMLSPEFIATTSTTTPSLENVLHQCVQEAFECS